MHASGLDPVVFLLFGEGANKRISLPSAID